MDINHFFSTPVFLLKDNKYSENIDQLLQEVYQWKDQDTTELVRSNKGGWHSDTHIFKRKEPGIQRLCKLMINTFNRCTKEIAPDFDITKMEIQGEGWVNVNPKHSYNVPHDHPGYTWSGVYYAKVRKRESGDRDGAIEFLDPRTSVAALATDIAKNSKYFSPKQTIHPQNGFIVIFPSYLRHWVYPHSDDEDRISFAFNIKYTPKKSREQLLVAAQQLANGKNRGPKK